MDKAIEWLREKGLAAQTKKAGKIAAEGVSYAIVDKRRGRRAGGATLRPTSWPRTTPSRASSRTALPSVAEQNPADVDALKAATYPGTDRTVAAVTADKVLAIGENLQIRRFVRYAERREHSLCPHERQDRRSGEPGRVEGIDDQRQASSSWARIWPCRSAAMNPTYVSSDEVPEAVVEKEKAVQLAKALEESAANTKIPAEKS